ncbi:MAG: peptidoglycan-binding domain-containing protein [Candidatus Paceibacterota bacterium]|jgi:hypothetical protein
MAKYPTTLSRHFIDAERCPAFHIFVHVLAVAVVAVAIHKFALTPFISKADTCANDHAVDGVDQDWTPTNGDTWDLDGTAGIAIAGAHCGIAGFSIPSGTVSVKAYDGASYGSVNITAASTTINGTLTAAGLGYAGGGGLTSGSGPGGGVGGADIQGNGGGHGGFGGKGDGGAGGTVYDSASTPTDMGSGGSGSGVGGYASGGTGGGLISLTISGTATIGGTISANGSNAVGGQFSQTGGGGAGGSILINTGTLNGAGTITANGGVGSSNNSSGGGGGGRIAIRYTTNNMFTSSNFDTYVKAYGGTHYSGGQDAGAGTIFTKSAAETYGEIFVANNGVSSNVGTGFADNTITLDALTIKSSGLMTHKTNTTAKTNYIDWTITDVTIDSGGSISISGKGYTGGSPTQIGNGPGGGGVGVTVQGDGGGHGGRGGDGGNGAGGGVAYDTATHPTDMGSGGAGSEVGGYASGGAGGGHLSILATGSFTLNGTIVANGSDGTSGQFSQTGGGGAGGGVYIYTNTLAGSGSITATGGAGTTNNVSGGGGGGIVAVHYSSGGSWSGSVAAAGGSGTSGGSHNGSTGAAAATADADFNPPTLDTVTIASNNSDTTKAGIGSIVTLTIVANEAIVSPTVTIAGRGANITGSGTSWTASTTMTADDPEIAIPFSITATDTAGNVASAVTSTTNSSSVTMDKSAPVLAPITITSNNSSTTRAKTDDIVTLSFTANKSIQTPVVTIDGRGANITGSGTTWQASTTMQAGDTEAVVTFSVTATDTLGNEATPVTATSNGSAVTFDKTVPTVPTVTISSSNSSTTLAKTDNVVTLAFTADESLRTPVVTIAGRSATVLGSGTTWTASTTMQSGDSETAVAFSITPTDAAGNEGSAVTAITTGLNVVFDKTVPTLSPVTISSNNTTNTLAKVADIVTLTFTSSEAIATPTVTIFGRPATVLGSGTSWTASTTMETGDTNGTVTFSATPIDMAGNSGIAVTAITSGSNVRFDKTPPAVSTVTISSNNTTNTLAKVANIVTLIFTTDENIKTPTVTIAGRAASVSGSNSSWSATQTMETGDTESAISFAITPVDLAGNVGTTALAVTSGSNVTFDKSAPTLSPVTIASNNNTTASRATTNDIVTLTFTANESITTPTVLIASRSANITGSGTSWTASTTMISGDTQQVIQFSITPTDIVGNAASAVTAITSGSGVTFDKSTPTISITTPTEGSMIATSTTPQVTTNEAATCTYSYDGADSVAFATTGGTTHTASAITGITGTAHTLTVTCNDLAGNVNTSATRNFKSLTTSGTTVTGGSEPVVFEGTSSGGVTMPSSITTLVLSESSPLSASTSLSSISGGNLTLNGSILPLGAFTSGSLVSVDLTQPQTIADKTVTVGTGFTLNSGTTGSPVVITGSAVSGTSLSIPDATSIMGPTDWDGKITPPITGSSAGTSPSGFLVGDAIQIGSADVTLIFDKAVTLTFDTVKTMVFKMAGSDTWQTLSTCAGTYSSPTDPTPFGECGISNGLQTKVLTYHFTTFGTLTAVPEVVRLASNNGPIYGWVMGLFSDAKPKVMEKVVPTVTPADSFIFLHPVISKRAQTQVRVPATIKGASSINSVLVIGSRGSSVTLLQRLLAQDKSIYKNGQVTGYFGNLTLQAVQKFQEKYGIAKRGAIGYGVVGPATRAMLVTVFGN